MLLLLSFFGSKENNYGCALNGSFLVESPAGSSKEGSSPVPASTIGKRTAWASEVRQHKNLQVDMIQQFCEQACAPITARKLYIQSLRDVPAGGGDSGD